MYSSEINYPLQSPEGHGDGSSSHSATSAAGAAFIREALDAMSISGVQARAVTESQKKSDADGLKRQWFINLPDREGTKSNEKVDSQAIDQVPAFDAAPAFAPPELPEGAEVSPGAESSYDKDSRKSRNMDRQKEASLESLKEERWLDVPPILPGHNIDKSHTSPAARTSIEGKQ